MAVRTVTTKLTVDGEKEFKRQLSEVNSSLKTMRSEMELVDAEFRGNANTLDALTKKNELLREEQEQQAEKVKVLEQAVRDAADAYGETDKRTDGYRQQLNKAKKDLIKMNDELEENEKYLDEARSSSDKCAKSIDGFGKEVKDAKSDLDGFGRELDDAGDALDDLGDKSKGAREKFSGLTSQLGEFGGLLTAGVVVGGVKAMGGAIIGVVEDTEEYRKVMGTLEVSSAAAGYSAEETKEAYMRLYGVLGDTQTAATTVANLQAIGLEQEDLMMVVDSAIGAWGTYGDSIPIDGLSEAINETVQTSKVTGVFADVLNWAGISEDEFNEKLATMSDKTERAQYVIDTLANQGLADLGEEWIETNDDIVKYNEAQEKANEAMAEMGEKLAPVAATLKTTFAGAVSLTIDVVEGLVSAVKTAVDWLGKLGKAQSDSATAHSGTNSSGRNNERSSHSRLSSSTTTSSSENDVKSIKSNAPGQAAAQNTTIVVKTNLDGKEVASTVTKYQNQNKRAAT